jgi:hypothetical protein
MRSPSTAPARTQSWRNRGQNRPGPSRLERIVAFSACWLAVGACNVITGANDLETDSRCKGESCERETPGVGGSNDSSSRRDTDPSVVLDGEATSPDGLFAPDSYDAQPDLDSTAVDAESVVDATDATDAADAADAADAVDAGSTCPTCGGSTCCGPSVCRFDDVCGACSASGGKCAADKDCCSGLKCNEQGKCASSCNTGVACIGAPCCGGYKCDSSYPYLCKTCGAPGVTCRGNSGCCSGTCRNGKCAPVN